MSTTETTVPTSEPISVGDLKRHLRIDLDDEDQYLAEFIIPAARRNVEAFARRALIHRSRRRDIDGGAGWPVSGCPIVLDNPPLASVTSIDYYASGSTTTTTIGSSVYLVDTNSEPGGVFLSPSQTWPAIDTSRHDAIQVTFVAGNSSNAESVPGDLRLAILITAAHLYEHRGDTITKNAQELPPAARELVRSTRNYRFV